MTDELEDAIVAALRAKAATAPAPAMPAPGAGPGRATRTRRARLVPIAAAAAVVVVGLVVGATLFAVDPRGGEPAAPPAAGSPTSSGTAPAAGEVYYLLRLTDLGAGGVLREQQLWQEPDRTGEWRQEIVQGTEIEDGRVVPGEGRVEAPDGGVCYPAFTATAESCTAPATWFNPTVEFLASAPRDPATIEQELRALAAAQVGTGGDDLVRVLELYMLGELLAGNGVPADLSGALREVAAALPGVTVTEDMANLTGERGTGYSLPDTKGGTVSVIFDDGDRYLGSPKQSVRHGVAPGLGEPPSRMLD